jgi:hypothetical protein
MTKTNVNLSNNKISYILKFEQLAMSFFKKAKSEKKELIALMEEFANKYAKEHFA